MKGRIVAIVGRPNVGKSAIFNRLAGRRLAIVHEQSGTTRDRLIAGVLWNERRFRLVDTGGIINMDGRAIRSAIDAGVRQQVDEALGDSAAVIFVVDVQAGMMPMDEYVAEVLHASGLPVFVAANKADEAAKDFQASEYEKFGYPVFPVSALHNRGFDPLLSAVVPCLPESDESDSENPIKVAVVGRPNVGKSSYINRLLRDERVIVSEVPGTTRDSVEVPFVVGSGPEAQHYLLIDTAGIRRADKGRKGLDYYSLLRTEKAIERADVVVVVTDASQGVTAQDLHIAGSVLENRKGCIVLVNKWDLSEVTQRATISDKKYILKDMGFVPVVFASAKTGYNIRKTVDAISHVASQVRTELPTGVLNRVIAKASEKLSPPMVSGKRLKIFYGTQTGIQPVTITLFVNDLGRMKSSYTSYMIRELRAAFGLEGAPVVLKLRSRERRNLGERPFQSSRS